MDYDKEVQHVPGQVLVRLDSLRGALDAMPNDEEDCHANLLHANDSDHLNHGGSLKVLLDEE